MRVVTVYVDKMRAPFRGMVMCHMMADTPAELHAMADKIGIKRSWYQWDASTPHYDLAQSKRKLALAAGAKEVTREELVEAVRYLRAQIKIGTQLGRDWQADVRKHRK